MSKGRLSRRLAVAMYREFLQEFGATITKQDEEQYADIFEGTLQGKKFKLRIHHNKDGELTKVDWQKITREDFQEIKSLFDEMIAEIIKLSDKAKAVALQMQMKGMKVTVKDEDKGAAP